MNILDTIGGVIVGALISPVLVEMVKSKLKKEHDFSASERKFYDDMIRSVYSFFKVVKRYEFDHSGEKKIPSDQMKKKLEKEYREFIDAADEFVGRSFVFLKEESYKSLKDAIDTSKDFSALVKNVLYAMRKSIHPETELKPEDDLKEFKY